MTSLKETLRLAAQAAFVAAFDCPSDFQAVVTPATQPQFGHFQCNSAMSLAKVLGRNPREIAQLVAQHLLNGDADKYLDRVEIAGPGFINVWLSRSFVSSMANELQTLGVVRAENPQRIVLDFSGPNVAKEMHVGHLRSTIIGDCLARVLSYLGHDVLRLNHIGDWGTAFGMLIAYLKEQASDVLSGSRQAQLPDLMMWYRAAKKQFDEESEFQDKARAQVVALQGGDPEARKAWKMICDISYQAYRDIYERLNIDIQTRGESFYNDWLPEIVDLLQEKKLLEESEGAQCVFLPGFAAKEGNSLPMIVQKRDGGYNYTTTDLAALRHRIDIEKADRLIYVTDVGQSLHFKMLFECSKKAGFWEEGVQQLDHVPFGLVLGSDGKKFKTRSGDVERLIDLLNEAVSRAKNIFRERHSDWSEKEINECANVLGIAAVKYADLSNHRLSDYQFSYDKMLAFDGNTAAFVLYAYVRTQGILRKLAGSPIESVLLTEPVEMDLAIHLLGFFDCLQGISEELTPNRLTDYLHKTAVLFNAFFRDCRVEGSVEQSHRLALVRWVASVLAQGLELLGIKTLDRM